MTALKSQTLYRYVVLNKWTFFFPEKILQGREEGRKGGREEGRKEGREEGRKGGREEGRKGGREKGRKGGRKRGTSGTNHSPTLPSPPDFHKNVQEDKGINNPGKLSILFAPSGVVRK